MDDWMNMIELSTHTSFASVIICHQYVFWSSPSTFSPQPSFRMIVPPPMSRTYGFYIQEFPYASLAKPLPSRNSRAPPPGSRAFARRSRPTAFSTRRHCAPASLGGEKHLVSLVMSENGHEGRLNKRDPDQARNNQKTGSRTSPKSHAFPRHIINAYISYHILLKHVENIIFSKV